MNHTDTSKASVLIIPRPDIPLKHVNLRPIRIPVATQPQSAAQAPNEVANKVISERLLL